MTAMNLLPQQVPFTPPSETISLTQYETAAVASAALSLWDRHHGRPLHDDQLLYDVESAAGNLPSRLQSALRRFRDKEISMAFYSSMGFRSRTRQPLPAPAESTRTGPKFRSPRSVN